VVQDAVLRVIRTIKPVSGEQRLLGWLRLVVQTTAFDQLRRERRRKQREALSMAARADEQIDDLQIDWLSEQINRLDPQLVKIIELRFEQDWTLRRIGQAMGISIGAVDGRLRRALKNLATASSLEEIADDPPMPELVGLEDEAGMYDDRL
jgi:RNA polymerase sigma factor (sigma-70 family)